MTTATNGTRRRSSVLALLLLLGATLAFAASPAAPAAAQGVSINVTKSCTDGQSYFNVVLSSTDSSTYTIYVNGTQVLGPVTLGIEAKTIGPYPNGTYNVRVVKSGTPPTDVFNQNVVLDCPQPTTVATTASGTATTGIDPMGFVVAGGLLVLGGVVLLAARRRPRVA